jgi:hypothetical protein
MVEKDQAARKAALERLDAFIGEWSMEASFLGAASAGVVGRSRFEWALGRQFLVQRSEIPHPDAPDSIAIIAFDSDDEAYTQHYFDSRGIARLYAMDFSGDDWTLVRESPDFSPLDFSQRFTGTFSDDGNTIHGRWETSRDGSTWKYDFDLRYTKAR